MRNLLTRLIRLIELFKPVEVTLNRSVNEFKLSTATLPRADKGETVEIPLWAAEILIDLGIAKLSVEKELSWLGRVHWRERVQLPKGELALSSIPLNFYSRSRNLFNYIRKATQIMDYKIMQARSMYQEIVDRRTRLLSELAFLDRMDVNLKSRISDSECVLLSELKRVLRSWLSEVGKIG